MNINDQTKILAALESLKEALLRERISLKLLPGVDILIHPELVDFFNQNPRLLLGGRYVLLELPKQSIPPHTQDFLFKMQLKGYFPIITHPERNSMIQNNPEILEELVRVGALVQVTAMSLTGEFGRQAQESASQLIKYGLVHSILKGEIYENKKVYQGWPNGLNHCDGWIDLKFQSGPCPDPG